MNLPVPASAAVLMAVAVCGCGHAKAIRSNTSAATFSSTIRLVRAEPAIVRSACLDAQKHTQVRVVCPALIPRTRYVRRAGLSGVLDFAPRFWAITFNNGDNGRGYVHWIAGAGRPEPVRGHMLGDARNEVKGLPHLVSRSRAERYVVSVYQYPSYPAGGPNGSHTGAFIRCVDMTFFASVHGHGDGRVAAAMAVDLANRSGCK
jgi:hypothetical protein